MKHLAVAFLFGFSALIPACAEKLIPAGSIVGCTISEPKISSKTLDVGDPVLCRLSHVEMYGRSVFPYGSYLVGRFEEYKDPGHLVGKGWMELKFDRLVVSQTDDVIPISARVVEVPKSKYSVDKQGRIHGTGHPVKDTVMWMIPVLWPLDLINLARRGPTPVLKAETKLTLKIMDDFGIPTKEEIREELQPKQPELIPRVAQQDAAPIERQAPVQQAYAPAAPQQYVPQPQTIIYNNIVQPQQQQPMQTQVVHVPVPMYGPPVYYAPRVMYPPAYYPGY